MSNAKQQSRPPSTAVGRRRPGTTRAALVLALTWLTGSAAAGERATVEFVDGRRTECEVLFKHPACERLVVRSLRHATLQSFALDQIAAVESGGRRTPHSPARPLTPAEKAAWEADGLWGDEATARQLGRYATETWERKPVMVWARPGESGDAMEPANWLDETGKPFAGGPWTHMEPVDKHGRKQARTGTFDGDVLLPAASGQYDAIQPGNRDHLGVHTLRHLTIERNAGYRVRYAVIGNFWVKDGAHLGSGTQTGGLGSGDTGKHTFLRFCGTPRPDPRRGEVDPEWAGISHWVRIDTGDQGSLELIGKTGGAGDRLTLHRGTFIVSEDSYIGNGNRGCYYSKEGTTTILLDGAGVGSLHALNSDNRATYGVAGTLSFGTDGHPLTRDLRFEGAHFRVEGVETSGATSDRTAGASFVFGPKSRVVVHSKDPATARVVFCPRPRANPVSQYVLPREHWHLTTREGPKPELWKLPIVPKGVVAVFAGQTEFNGIVFDGFQEGGIVVRPEARARWRNVSWGPSNLAPPEKLFRDLPEN